MKVRLKCLEDSKSSTFFALYLLKDSQAFMCHPSRLKKSE